MAIVVTGANGQLGRALRAYIPEATFLSRNQLDISDAVAMQAYDWRDVKVIINAAAYTKVDEAETEAGKKKSRLADYTGVVNLAAVARRYSILLIHVSSEYVFNGRLRRPYRETDAVGPLSVYGRSKLAGESVVQELEEFFLVRTSSLYFEGGVNFPAAILGRALAGRPLRVNDYQLTRPTYAGDLARVLVKLGRREAPYGVYHCQNSGQPVSWFEYAKKVLELAALSNPIEPLSRTEFELAYPKAALRPDYGVLDLAKLDFYSIKMPAWTIPLAAEVPKMRRSIEAQIKV